MYSPTGKEEKKMERNISTAIVAVIAVALIFVATNISAAANTGYLVAAVVLMAAYCFGQYKLSKNYR